jgi:hypothetical protein
MYCKACHSEKPETAFYSSNRTRCKECIKASVRENRLEKIDYYRQYDRMRSSQPHRKANNFAQSHEWRQQFPNRMRAQSLVGHALRSGKLTKQLCLVCGSEKVVAHHADYDRPLDVVWLCQAHHKQAHALVANQPDMQEAA